MKKEKIRVEHEKNLLEIQMRQYDDIFKNKQIEYEQVSIRMKEFEGKYKHEHAKAKELVSTMQEKDD